jgi:hypothetical protein
MDSYGYLWITMSLLTNTKELTSSVSLAQCASRVGFNIVDVGNPYLPCLPPDAAPGPGVSPPDLVGLPTFLAIGTLSPGRANPMAIGTLSPGQIDAAFPLFRPCVSALCK